MSELELFAEDFLFGNTSEIGLDFESMSEEEKRKFLGFFG
jgi:hypothetical protein